MPRFLIVDDDLLSLKILADFFKEFAECDTAADGVEAYEHFEKSVIEGKPYTLICTDLIMPNMDGRDFIRKIRARETTLPIADFLRTPIFVISASDSVDDMRTTLLDCDADDYVVKPFRREQVKNLLSKYKLVEEKINEP